jgi:hypothetical protein
MQKVMKISDIDGYALNTPAVKAALDEGRKLEDGTLLNWPYFAELIKIHRNQHVRSWRESESKVERKAIEKIIAEHKLEEKLNKDVEYAFNCVFFYILEPIAKSVSEWTGAKTQYGEYAEGHAIRDWINNIRNERTKDKIGTFLLWFWQKHETVAEKFYKDLNVELRTRPRVPDKVRPPIRYKPTETDSDNPFHETLVTYQGRKELREKLEAFAQDPAKFKIWAISGPSGSGKTRLSRQWMQESETMQGWDQLILGIHDMNNDHKREFWGEWEPIYPTLVVIDYLYVYTDAFDTLIKQCLALQTKHAVPPTVRVLLIDHVFPRTLEELLRDKRMQQFTDMDRESIKALFFNGAKPLDLMEIDDLSTIMPLILCEAAGTKVSKENIQAALEHLKSLKMAWYPLFAVLLGFTLKKAQEENEEINITAWNRRQLIMHYLTKNTRLVWKLKNNKVNGTYAAAFIAAATALRGANFRLLTQHKPDHPKAISVNYNEVESLCRSVLSVPIIVDQLPPFEPDILGETFFLLFVEAMLEDYDLLGAFRDTFTRMLSEGEADLLVNDAEKFIGFIINLTRNLCNDDQNDIAVQQHWNTLLNFLKPEQFPAESTASVAIMRWAVSAALIDMAELIRWSNLEVLRERYDQLLEKVEIDIFSYGRTKSQFLYPSFYYARLHYNHLMENAELYQTDLPPIPPILNWGL